MCLSVTDEPFIIAPIMIRKQIYWIFLFEIWVFDASRAHPHPCAPLARPWRRVDLSGWIAEVTLSTYRLLYVHTTCPQSGQAVGVVTLCNRHPHARKADTSTAPPAEEAATPASPGTTKGAYTHTWTKDPAVTPPGSDPRNKTM